MSTLMIRLVWFAALMVPFSLGLVVPSRYKPALFIVSMLTVGAFALLPGTTTFGRVTALTLAVIGVGLLFFKLRRG